MARTLHKTLGSVLRSTKTNSFMNRARFIRGLRDAETVPQLDVDGAKLLSDLLAEACSSIAAAEAREVMQTIFTHYLLNSEDDEGQIDSEIIPESSDDPTKSETATLPALVLPKFCSALRLSYEGLVVKLSGEEADDAQSALIALLKIMATTGEHYTNGGSD
jgi:hypothetical protein